MLPVDFLLEKIKAREKIFLIFDYDGTLTPIVDTPDKAVLDTKTRTMIESLAKQPNLKIAIVSGRSIKDLQVLSGIKSQEIIISGSHGGEVLYQEQYNVISNVPKVAQLDDFKIFVKKALNNFGGIIFEEKPFSFSIHYRLAKENDVGLIKQLIIEQFERMELNKHFKIQPGKKVIEIIPESFNKGKTVKSILKMFPQYFYVYFGDDLTDISAFNVVKQIGGMPLGIKDQERSFENVVDQALTHQELLVLLEKICEGTTCY